MGPRMASCQRCDQVAQPHARGNKTTRSIYTIAPILAATRPWLSAAVAVQVPKFAEPQTAQPVDAHINVGVNTCNHRDNFALKGRQWAALFWTSGGLSGKLDSSVIVDGIISC